jgi:hypothetical protein
VSRSLAAASQSAPGSSTATATATASVNFGGAIVTGGASSGRTNTTLLGAVLGAVLGVAAIVAFAAFFVITRRKRHRDRRLSHHYSDDKQKPGRRVDTKRPPSELDWSNNMNDLDSAGSVHSAEKLQDLPKKLGNEKSTAKKTRRASGQQDSPVEDGWMDVVTHGASVDDKQASRGLLVKRSTSHGSAFAPVVLEPSGAAHASKSPVPVITDTGDGVAPASQAPAHAAALVPDATLKTKQQPMLLESVGHVGIADIVENPAEAGPARHCESKEAWGTDVVSPPVAKKKSQRDPSHKHHRHHSKHREHREHREHRSSKHKAISASKHQDDSKKVEEAVDELVASMAMKQDLDTRLQKRLASHDTDASLIAHLLQEREKVATRAFVP